jgi:thiol-disulfide isomerase/thioredoxin
MLLRLLFVLSLVTNALVAVEIGDSKNEVVAEMGRPRSTIGIGSREILSYGTGKVVLTDGKVSAVDAHITKSPASAVNPPKSTPVVKAPSAPPRAPASRIRAAHWHTNLAQAKSAAARSNKRILALFTGSDWCPPCQMFEAEVAHDQQFVGIFASSFVFYKCDWLRNTPQPPAVEQEVSRVRREYGISQYPTLMVLNAEGEELDEVDWTSVRGGSFKEIMIEAIDDSRIATKDGKKASSSWWPF